LLKSKSGYVPADYFCSQ